VEILLTAAAASLDAAVTEPALVDASEVPGVEAGERPVTDDVPPTQLATQPAIAGSDVQAVPPVATPEPAGPQTVTPTDSSVRLQDDNSLTRPAGPAFPEAVAFDWQALVEHDLLASVPADVPELLRALGNSDLYVQDEADVRLHPTLTRVWSRKGHRGQRLVRAPGQSSKFVTFLAADWRDGWGSVGYSPRRTADVFCLQLDSLVERSQARGRAAMVILDGAKIHRPEGSKLVRQTLAKHGDRLRLVYTPAYDPESNPTERAWPPFRRAVTHNHHRDETLELYEDTRTYMDDLTEAQTLRQIGSPLAAEEPTHR
jgi:transposase